MSFPDTSILDSLAGVLGRLTPGTAIDGESAIAYNSFVDIDIPRVREFLREKQARRRRRLEERLRQAQEDAGRIIEHLGRTYSPRRIYQWGSLVETRNFSEISDIDIGVEGLSGPEQYFAMLGDALGMTRFSVDLLELDKLNKETADHIRRRGRVVYERPSAG